MKPLELTKARLAHKAIRHGECLIWTGPKAGNGYGAIKSGGKQVKVHRASYELSVGQIPDGMHVLHRCDQPACIEPAHLFLGTHEENMADRTAKGRHAVHYGEDNGHAKLTADLVVVLRARYKPKHRKDGAAAMAREVGVHPDTLRAALFGDSWKHI